MFYGKVYLSKISVNKGGYDVLGVYWGGLAPGEHMYCAADEHGIIMYQRAHNRTSAGKQIEKRLNKKVDWAVRLR